MTIPLAADSHTQSKHHVAHNKYLNKERLNKQSITKIILAVSMKTPDTKMIHNHFNTNDIDVYIAPGSTANTSKTEES